MVVGREVSALVMSNDLIRYGGSDGNNGKHTHTHTVTHIHTHAHTCTHMYVHVYVCMYTQQSLQQKSWNVVVGVFHMIFYCRQTSLPPFPFVLSLSLSPLIPSPVKIHTMHTAIAQW